jgi:glyoxylase-like metal-dependent hydrolase (beta-lactamase superfamily II)
MRTAAIGFLIVVAVLIAAVSQRHAIMFWALSSDKPPPLLEKQDEGADVTWVDEYFTIQALDDRTWAIGEPRYYQQVFSYLIVGSARAVLFDAGPGFYDIRPIVKGLTDLPITFIPSHFHYDHTGNQITFQNVAVVDMPYLRERAVGGVLPLTSNEHLGFLEGIEIPTLEVDEWLAVGSEVSLGDRNLRVLHTPGHTKESISLLDQDSAMLFTGDFIGPGILAAFSPNSSMGDYARGVKTVMSEAQPEVRVFGAHRITPPGAPEIEMQDVEDLQSALGEIRSGELAGEGIYPVIYKINNRIDLWTEPSWLQDWTPNQLSAVD